MRTINEINEEFSKACANLGQHVYNTEVELVENIKKAQTDAAATITNLKTQISKLKKEAAHLNEVENKKKARETTDAEIVKPATLVAAPDA